MSLHQAFVHFDHKNEVIFPENHVPAEPFATESVVLPKRRFCSTYFDLEKSQKIALGDSGDLYLSKHCVRGFCSLKRFHRRTPVSVAWNEVIVMRELKGGPILPMLGGFYDGALTLVLADCTGYQVI